MLGGEREGVGEGVLDTMWSVGDGKVHDRYRILVRFENGLRRSRE